MQLNATYFFKMLFYDMALVALLLSTFSQSALATNTRYPQLLIGSLVQLYAPYILFMHFRIANKHEAVKRQLLRFLSTKTNLKERLIKLFRPPMVTLCHAFNGCQARPQIHYPVSHLSYRPRRIPKSVQKQLTTIRLDVYPRPQRTNFD